MVRAIHAMERRLQDVERKFQNMMRLGKVAAVKYEKDRWYVKMNDGQDQTPSGSETYSKQDTFKSDWQAWGSHSHETIKISSPPKVGQDVVFRSVGGSPELGVVEPFHYGPKAPSPHGKQDETVALLHDKDKNQHWIFQSKDTNQLIIKKKQQSGAPTGLGDVSGLGDMAHVAQMSGFSGADFSGMMSSLGGIANIGNLANIDISNIANLAGIGGLGNIAQLAKFGSVAKLSGLPGLSTLGNISQVASQVKSAGLMGRVGSMIGGGAGGGAGDPAQSGEDQKEEAPKLPDIPKNGEDGVTQVKTSSEGVLKTVGKDKSYYFQNDEKVNIRFGEENAKGDIMLDKDQLKVQFKDKKSVFKLTENDLTAEFGENKSKIVLNEDAAVINYGESKVTVKNGHIEISGETDCSFGVNGMWVTITGGQVHLGVGSPGGTAASPVVTVAGPSSKVFANV